MRLIPPVKEDNDTVDTGNQDVDSPGNGGPSPESSEDRISDDELQLEQEQTNGMMDIVLTTSNREDLMGSCVESMSPFARLLEEEPNFPSCFSGSAYFLPRMMMDPDFPPFSIRLQRDETTDKLEGLLGILDMALAIVNGN
jgi:hypothetical protein